MSEVLDFDNGSESISDIIYESNMTDMELQSEDVGRTLSCILCGGTIDYKNQDPTTFRNHMKDQHGAFHQIDYILASCFLSKEELGKVARRPLVELGAQELEEVEGLQETLAEDLESPQESLGGKRDAEEMNVGTPTKKRKYAKAKEGGHGEVKCDHCEKKYSSKNSLANHLKKCHAAGIKKELVIESSGEGSVGEVALDESNIINITNHGEEAESMVELDDSMNSSQEQSEQVEQDAKKFACDLCDKKFVSEQGRRTHKTRKHGSDQPLLLACEYQDCALAFLKNSELRKHEIAMHNRVPRSWKSKNVKKESAAGSVFEYNSSEEVAAGSEAEDASDVDSSVANDPADDISIAENKASAAECEDSINEGEPEEGSITEEAEDISITDDNGDIEGVTEDEDITAKYQDVPVDSDTSMDLADVIAVDQESREAAKEVSRFVCSFGCGKSYSAKCNLSNHEIKVHNRPKLKSRKSQKPTASPKKLDEKEGEAKVETSEEPTDDGIISDNKTGETGAEEARVEKLEESNASSFFNDSSLGDFDFEEKEQEVGEDTAAEGAADGAADGPGPVLSEVDAVEEGADVNEVDEETRNEGEEEEEEAPSKEAILAKLRKGGAMNVLADFPLPKENQETEEEALDGSPTERMSGTLDLKASEYFTKYPKAIANPQERSLKLFNEDAEGLPEGWKVRLLKDPRDEGKTVRHYLSPDMRVLKTGQGVVEYLRLEGSLPTDQILNIAKSVLLLSEKKINALYL